MGVFKPLALLVLVLGVLSLAACGQSSTLQGTSDASGTQLSSGGGLPSIPLDNGPAREASSGGGGTMSVLGKDFLYQRNGVVDGDSLFLDPPGGDAIDGHVAWGLYQFSGLTGKDVHTLNVQSTPGGPEQEYFVGIADYTTGSWVWFGPSQVPEFEIDLTGNDHRFVTQLGNMYFIVVVEGDNVATHHQSTLIYGEDDGSDRPGAPHGLHASDGTFGDHVAINWEPGAGAAYYEVYRRVDGGDMQFVKIGQTEGTEFADTDVTPGTRYIYKARSGNDAGFSEFSNTDSGYAAVEGGGGDNCPSELVATDGTYPDKVRLEWNGVQGVHYDVYRHGPESEYEVIGTSDGPSYNDFTAEPGVTYEYKAGYTSPDGTVCFSNGDNGFASQDGGGDDACPSQLVATDGTYPDKVRLEWSGISGNVYKVFRKLAQHDGDYALIGSTDNGGSFNDTTAEPNTVYNYKVALWQHDATVCWSNDDNGYRAQSGTPDDCPSELTASDGTTQGGIALHWGGNGDRGYDVYRRVDGSGDDGWAAIAFVQGLEYFDASAEPEVVYIYKIGLERDGGVCFSNLDSGVWHQEGGGGEDNCPSELSASDDGVGTGGVSIGWTGVGDSMYDVYRRQDGFEQFTVIGEANHEYFDQGAEPGIVYFYKVGYNLPDGSVCFSNVDSGTWRSGDGGGDPPT